MKLKRKEYKLKNILKWGKHSITLFCYSLCFRHRLLLRLLLLPLPPLPNEFHPSWATVVVFVGGSSGGGTQGTLNQTCTLNSPQCVSGIGQNTEHTHTHIRTQTTSAKPVSRLTRRKAKKNKTRSTRTNANQSWIKTDEKCNKDWYGSSTRILIYFNVTFMRLYIYTIGCRAY